MRVVLQRVSEASVTIEKQVKSSIKKGFLILIGIEAEDTPEDIDWLCRKIVNMRIFGDEDDKMNLSLQDINGEALIISQFTLHASVKKGNRPSFIKAAKPNIAIPLYEAFIKEFEKQLQKPVGTGSFGADMKVSLVNDGPVTINLDSKNKE
ncbi:D-aminoacyl-tRNA deacylase [Mesonia aestuariivivens]|uniref:D-aminoacyl-tRNA deacylase n=1 Tax=Mesonia aestuariivivens TaxID=2796128 RepID=A0ABS6W4L2_9FLAO|nr:D-aminoacyl-tRNA deacylase [Mesonia aestuariivivens]MBW2962659.1 D-tyrosyl-tRNA(Tyr) deacylase [Mesonia aestuariivivens]